MNFFVDDTTSRIMLGEEDVYDETTSMYYMPEFPHHALIGSRDSMNDLRTRLNNMTLPQRVMFREARCAGERAGIRLKEMFGTK